MSGVTMPTADAREETPTSPLVSIIVNNYNYARFLEQAIDSALAQTHAAVEVIVVDDGSTDDSREVIAKYGSRVRAVLKENGGQASAFNAGYAVSSGEIVMFLDSDDFLYPDAVATVVERWVAGTSKLHFRLDVVDDTGRRVGRVHPAPEVQLPHGDAKAHMLSYGPVVSSPTSGNAFSRRALHALLPIPEAEYRICADSYLLVGAPFYGPVIAEDRPLGAYRVHGRNAWGIGLGAVSAAELQRYVRHAIRQEELLAAMLRRFHDPVGGDVVGRFHGAVFARLASLREDRRGHPVPSDRLMSLLWRGYRSVWRRSNPMSLSLRVMLSAWALWVAIMPLPLVRPAVAWLMVPGSRPKPFEAFARLLRPTPKLNPAR